VTIPAQNQTPDTALRETANAKAQLGTHLATDAASDALFVQRGTGTLGDAQGALDVQPGTGLVVGVEHTVSSIKPVDIAVGDGSPRRDVVYLDSSGALAVAKGTPDAFAWDTALSESERTISNAYRPAPPDLSETEGLALAVVTVPANATTLPTGAITELRAEAPSATATGAVNGQAIQAALDGRVVAVAPGTGISSAIDPASTNTPITDAHALLPKTGNVVGGTVLVPPGGVDNAGSIPLSSGVTYRGWGPGHSPDQTVSEIKVTATGVDLVDVHDPDQGSVRNACLDGVAIQGPGKDTTTGVGINIRDPTARLRIGHVYFSRFANALWTVSARMTETYCEGIIAEQFDPAAGGSDTCIDWTNPGPGAGGFVGHLGLYPVPSQSDSPVEQALDVADGGTVAIGNLNVGGVCKRAARITGSGAAVSIDVINHEPSGLGNLLSAAEDPVEIVFCGGESAVNIGSTTFYDAGHGFTLKSAYTAGGFSNGNNHFGPFNPRGVSVSGGTVRITSDTTEQNIVHAPSSEVVNETGGPLSVPVQCLGDGRQVPPPATSTSTDYTANRDEMVFADTSSGSLTVTLPAAAASAAVEVVNAYSAQGNAVTIATPGTGQVGGGETETISGAAAARRLICDGTDWWAVP
jgi:hypothetical protein